MKRLLCYITLMGLTISLSAQTVSSAEKDSKLQELEDVISLNSTQKIVFTKPCQIEGNRGRD